MNTNHRANRSAVTAPTGPTAREVLPLLGFARAATAHAVAVSNASELDPILSDFG
jgi:hypothetical protein